MTAALRWGNFAVNPFFDFPMYAGFNQEALQIFDETLGTAPLYLDKWGHLHLAGSLYSAYSNLGVDPAGIEPGLEQQSYVFRILGDILGGDHCYFGSGDARGLDQQGFGTRVYGAYNAATLITCGHVKLDEDGDSTHKKGSGAHIIIHPDDTNQNSGANTLQGCGELNLYGRGDDQFWTIGYRNGVNSISNGATGGFGRFQAGTGAAPCHGIVIGLGGSRPQAAMEGVANGTAGAPAMQAVGPRTLLPTGGRNGVQQLRAAKHESTIELLGLGITSWTTIRTLTPSAASSVWTGGTIEVDVMGSTNAVGQGGRTQKFWWTLTGSTFNTGTLNAASGGLPPDSRLNWTGSSIQIQVQSNDGTHCIEGGMASIVAHLPSSAGTNVTWAVS